MREAFTLPCGEFIIHGTAHFGTCRSGRGIIFFNSGAQPRSSRGDLTVHIADALSALGYDCFRVDLPGLGDSSGPLPAHYADLYKDIQNGCHAESADKIVQHLISNFALRKLFFLGLCGGAATAVFLTPKLPRHLLGGLMLFDLPFEEVREYQSSPANDTGASPARSVTARLRLLKGKLHDWLLGSRWEPQVTAAYFALKRFCLRFTPARLPHHANRHLLQQLLGILQSRLPVLLVSAVPIKNAPSDAAYFNYLKSRGFESLHLHYIHGTTHSFVENGGLTKVLELVTAWLAASPNSLPHASGAIQPQTESPTAQNFQHANTVL